jgi:hypothetical protein
MMFPAVGVALRSLHPVTGGELCGGLKFQSCLKILDTFFNNSGNFWVLLHHCYSFPYLI